VPLWDNLHTIQTQNAPVSCLFADRRWKTARLEELASHIIGNVVVMMPAGQKDGTWLPEMKI
jgi:hypothetical protein